MDNIKITVDVHRSSCVTWRVLSTLLQLFELYFFYKVMVVRFQVHHIFEFVVEEWPIIVNTIFNSFTDDRRLSCLVAFGFNFVSGSILILQEINAFLLFDYVFHFWMFQELIIGFSTSFFSFSRYESIVRGYKNVPCTRHPAVCAQYYFKHKIKTSKIDINQSNTKISNTIKL